MLLVLDLKGGTRKPSQGKYNAAFSSDVEINNNNSNNVPHYTERNKIDKESANKSPSRNLFIEHI